MGPASRVIAAFPHAGRAVDPPRLAERALGGGERVLTLPDDLGLPFVLPEPFTPGGVRIAPVPLQLEAALHEKLRLDQPDGSCGGDLMGPPVQVIGFVGAAGLVEGLAQHGQGLRFPGGVVPLA
ncbi:hypothetical protein ACG2OD_15175 [Streptomyces sp. PDY-4]|uniref:hypothetical protein n=1 Tax=Streptomyces sp. PDY-4 TaxID=3376070 RepID=UPI00378B48A0